MRSRLAAPSRRPVLVGVSALLFFVAYAFKAWGWQRLFAKHERPAPARSPSPAARPASAASRFPAGSTTRCGSRCVKRFPGTRVGLGTVGLSLIVLGMLDNAALTPLASVAAVSSSSMLVRAGFLVVAVAGVLAALVVAFLPMLARRERVTRYRVGRWLASHTQCTKEAGAALALRLRLLGLRGAAVFLLLNALSLQGSFALALAVPLRVGRVGRAADRARGRCDSGRCRCRDSHGERHEGRRGARVLGRGSGARRSSPAPP